MTSEKKSPSEPVIIAGPCSAETRDQVFGTARSLLDAGISYFRAGIWKPRTSPDSFEGVGTVGLKWLKELHEELGMQTAIEVANARHVEEALEHGIHLLWLGARTSVNPFAVQEIADALKGVKVPVMVKNPINPDLGLWAGAIERILRADVASVIACHRGFNIYGKSVLRNQPLWEIPIDLKRKYPNIPLICDPSHISGKREYISRIAHKALDLGYEGLMIEAHENPDEAWSDAQQQLTPDALKLLLKELSFRQASTDNLVYKAEISSIRREMDAIDEELLETLAKRMELSRNIGTLKKNNNVAFYQHNRWTEIIENCKENAEKLHLSEEFLMKLFSLIHLESIDMQGE